MNSTTKSFEHIELEIKWNAREKKIEELYEQLRQVEMDRVRLCIRFEDENKSLSMELESKNIENSELKKHIEIYEEKLNQ